MKQSPFNVWATLPTELAIQIFEYVVAETRHIKLFGQENFAEYFGRLTGMPTVFAPSSPVRDLALAAVFRTNTVESSEAFRVGHIATERALAQLGMSRHVRTLRIVGDVLRMDDHCAKAVVSLINSLPRLDELEYEGSMYRLIYENRVELDRTVDEMFASILKGIHFMELSNHPSLRRIWLREIPPSDDVLKNETDEEMRERENRRPKDWWLWLEEKWDDLLRAKGSELEIEIEIV